MAYENLTDEDKEALSIVAKAVLLDPDFIDDLINDGQIVTDPTLLALRLVQADVNGQVNYDSSRNFLGIGSGIIAGAVAKVGSLFKNKDKGQESTGFLKNVFQKVGTKVNQWKDNRALKKELKASGDPDWKDTFKAEKLANKIGDAGKDTEIATDSSSEDEGAEPTVSDYRNQTGSTTASDVPGSGSIVLPPGVTMETIEAGLKQLEKQAKELKVWKIIGIGAGIGLIGALIWAFTK